MNVATALGYAVTIINGAEGFSAKAYCDRLAAPPLWTIGHGTTRVDGNPVSEGMTCTKAQADLWAMADMTSAAHTVLNVVHVALNDWQLAALISFCYNIGAGHFVASSVVSALNLARYDLAADRLLDYDEAGGKVVAGLKTRRGRERALFLLGNGAYRPPASPTHAEPSEADVLNQSQLDALLPTTATL